MYDFLCQMVPNPHFTYYLQIVPTTYYPPNPILCYYPPLTPNSFISDLVYATCTDPILRSNLNFKKLLKCVNTTNFLHINLN